jgi:hypothetical protein
VARAERARHRRSSSGSLTFEAREPAQTCRDAARRVVVRNQLLAQATIAIENVRAVQTNAVAAVCPSLLVTLSLYLHTRARDIRRSRRVNDWLDTSGIRASGAK